MQLQQYQKDALITEDIPGYMHSAIIDYYEKGYQPGGFLTALINNDLRETFARADDTNIRHIRNYIMWFYNFAPGGTWGYPDAVETWINSAEFKRESS